MDEKQNLPSKETSKQSVPVIHRVNTMFENWFLDYASYVILERAIPSIYDGLKPVQRRIFHSMKELDDGRYSKVANLVGNTMKYHPHGDASIYDAMVQLGNKDLLIDRQGNWGNLFTGDSAAAARYIEARLTPFALEVLFSPKITQWKDSYDGRNKEPLNLPVKFPLLLFQGVEGIAVGLSTKILPHNFNELLEASVKCLQNKNFELYPDFPTGGFVDVTGNKDGLRGSKIKVRAKLSKGENNTIVIEDIPFGTDTNKLIESILKANEKGKIKIKKIEDNTADKVEIVVNLAPKVSLDQTIDALYVFTDCEMSLSPNACVIQDEKPLFIGVTQILKHSVDYTKELLRQELDLKKRELETQVRNLNLERIFIENRIYRDIENQTDWDGVMQAIRIGMTPHLKQYQIDLMDEDIVRLTEIKIKKISKFDVEKTNELIKKIEVEIAEIVHHIEHIVDFTIQYFKGLKKKYGKGRERKTQIKIFDTIEASEVAVNDTKLYMDRANGFIGTNLGKEAELVCECSSIDDILVFRKDGVALMNKLSSKVYVGKNIVHVGIYNKADERTVYNLIYMEGKDGPYYMKRFHIGAMIRGREYHLAGTNEKSKLMYFSANPNGEGDVVKVTLSSKSAARKNQFQMDMSDLLIKGRGVKGNLVSKYPIKNILFIRKGKSNLPAQEYWFDKDSQKLNTENRGESLGKFEANQRILHATRNGDIFIKEIDKNERFEESTIWLQRLDLTLPVFCIYYDAQRKEHYLKAFVVESDEAFAKRNLLPTQDNRSYVECIVQAQDAKAILHLAKGTKKSTTTIGLKDFVSIASINARGKRLTNDKIRKITLENIVLPNSMPNEKTTTDETTEGSLF